MELKMELKTALEAYVLFINPPTAHCNVEKSKFSNIGFYLITNS